MGPGDLIAERYELVEAVGAGGMGIVYKARDVSSGAQVAVKLVPSVPRTAKRFKREAEVLAQLRHPGVVRYVDDGRASRGQRFLVMEWLDGEDLEARLDRGRLPIADAVGLARRVAEALGAVHELGVIHRDLKPANIFLVDGEIAKAKVLDFGIAHVSASIALTQTGMTLGTPGYMSPEQVQRDPNLGPRADLFALGCVLFECLAGRAPFVGASAVHVMQQVLREPVPHLHEVRLDAPLALANLLDRLLSKDPAGRPADGATTAEELKAVEEVLAAAGDRVSAPLILTKDEQVFVAILVSGRPDRPPPTTLVDADIPLTRPSPIPDAPAGGAYGAIPTTLGNGLPGLLLPQQGSARELAVRSARCALEIRDRSPSECHALVMGHARLRDIVPIGDVSRRPAAVLRGAAPGELRIDSVTAGLLPSRFVVFERDQHYTLLREDPVDAPARLLAGRATRFVGRDAELAQLERVTRDSLAGAPRAALIVGEAGIGKSRLMHELSARLRAPPLNAMLWSARSEPMASPPYGLIAQWLREGAGVQPTHTAEQIERALRSIVTLHCAPEEIEALVAFLGELIGLAIPDGASVGLDAARNDPRLMRDRVRATLLTFLGKLSRSRPLILCAEDLHSADRPSLELLSELASEPGLPVAVVATAASRLDREQADALEGAGFLRVDLGPLPEDVARAVVEERLESRATQGAIERVVRCANGNPYFLEELMRQIDEQGDADELPETVLGMVRDRFESLAGPARRVLRAASVFGQSFRREGVEALLGDDPDAADTATWLAALLDLRILGWDPGGADGEPTYRFRHEIQREAAYAALTAEDRQLGHLLAGRFLARRNTTQSVRLAMHFERANAPELAREHHQRAAEDALRSYDFEAVREHAEAAIGGGADPELRGRLRLLQAQASDLKGERARARVFAEKAIGVLDDPMSFCVASRIIVSALAGGGRSAEAASFGRSVLRRIESMELGDAELAELIEMGFGLVAGDSRPIAEELIALGDARAIRGQLESPNAKAALAGLKGRRAMQDGDVADYLERTRERRALQQSAQNLRGVCWSDATIGYLLLELGAYAEAEHVIRAAGALARQLGLDALIAQADHNLGLVLAHLGRADEGAQHEREAIGRLAALGLRRATVASRIYLAKIHLAQGDVDGAAREADHALRLAPRQAPTLRGLAAAVRARAHLERGEGEAALALAEAAAPDLDGLLETGESELRLTWAESLRALDRTEEALDVIREANARLLERASKIHSAAHRESFLKNVPENAQTIALYQAWTR